MPLFELPRALEHYFAFAETTPTRKGRRFSISLPYFAADGRLDRFQWWYHVSAAQEPLLGEAGMAALRARETERFRQHIERWLETNGQRMHGTDPIPQVGPARASTGPAAAPAAEPDSQSKRLTWPADKVANG
jgi:hypothetical protein